MKRAVFSDRSEISAEYGSLIEQYLTDLLTADVRVVPSFEISGGCERQKTAKLRRKLVLDDRASETARTFRSNGSSRGSFIVGRQAFNFTSGHATYILYLLLLLLLLAFFLYLLPLPSPFARSLARSSSLCPSPSFSRVRLSSRHRHANSRDARNIKP